MKPLRFALMSMLLAFGLAAVLACGGGSCGRKDGCFGDGHYGKSPKPRPSATASKTVRSGTYCRQAGATAKTDAGLPMVCATTASDKRLRWRAR